MPPRARKKRRRWTELPFEELLDVRLNQLKLKIRGTMLEPCILRLYGELKAKGIRFRPHFWLSNEWFSPEGVPGVGIPFYLAHPKLMKLELRQMLEVEGGTQEWCMAILRHEAGHAIDTAFRLHRKRSWSRIFGKSSEPYPQYYTPSPFSRKFVLHLDWWYAQSHPLEDFAETFAVWLKPSSKWRQRYHGWPAITKIRYVDQLMKEIRGQRAPVQNREKVDALPDLKRTLRTHYNAKRDKYGAEFPDFYDRDLGRLFSSKGRELASSFLRRHSAEIRELVSSGTGLHQYTIDQVLKQMTTRAKTLKLRVAKPERKVKMDAIILVTAQTMNYLHSGRHMIAL